MDISDILKGWQYDGPRELMVRKITGKDGLPKIQMRVDLGILQMEWTERPDGKEPHGKPSLLDYYLEKEDEQSLHPEMDGELSFSGKDLEALQMESYQYYYRRISFFQLEAYEEACGDAEHNLQIMDLVKKYAEDDEDKLAFEQYRPFVLMHRTKATGLISTQRHDIEGALRHIENGIEEIEEFFHLHDRSDLIDESQELKVLRNMAEDIKGKRPAPEENSPEPQPKSLEESLNEELLEAVELENFERAAEIRDELKKHEENSNT